MTREEAVEKVEALRRSLDAAEERWATLHREARIAEEVLWGIQREYAQAVDDARFKGANV